MRFQLSTINGRIGSNVLAIIISNNNHFQIDNNILTNKFCPLNKIAKLNLGYPKKSEMSPPKTQENCPTKHFTILRSTFLNYIKFADRQISGLYISGIFGQVFADRRYQFILKCSCVELFPCIAIRSPKKANL